MEKLTKRECDIIELLMEGLSNRQIAKRLFVSTHTIKAILEKIYQKTGIHNRILLVLYYYRHISK